MNKKHLPLIFFTLSFFLAFGSFSSRPALADGMVLPPSNRYIYETEQKAVIWYDEKTQRETLVLSISFEGDAEDFAWVVPVPSKPEVEKARNELFLALEELTAPTVSRVQYDTGYKLMAPEASDNAVTVVESKEIGYYHIDVLSSTDAGELAKWLSDNDYHYPEKYSYVLEDYMGDTWHFVAVKVNQSKSGDYVSGQLNSGNATPLKISFGSERIFYPMKISGVLSQEGSPEVDTGYDRRGVDPTYIDSPRHKYLVFDGNDDYVSLPRMNLNGYETYTLEMWVKPDDFLQENGWRKRLASFADLDLALYETNAFSFYSTSYGSYITSSNYTPGRWYHLALVKSTETSGDKTTSPRLYYEDTEYDYNDREMMYPSQPPIRQTPKYTLYINGEEVTTFRGGITNHSIESTLLGVGVRNTDSTYRGHFKGSMDELRVWSVARTSDEIVANMNKHISGSLPGLVGYWDFNGYGENIVDSSLYARHGKLMKMVYSPQVNTANKRVQVELYVFSKDKTAIPGYSTTYAGWLNADKIENLASDPEDGPWMDVSNSAWLTKMSRSMLQSEMTEDIFVKTAEDNTIVGSGSGKLSFMTPLKGTLFFVPIAVEILLIIRWKRKKKEKN
ncbi:DUF2330 domain-containing protein [Patescibacteria group bacterium]|nr:DUF2330 domain-containing protein [Patescibacteria group bacterium]